VWSPNTLLQDVLSEEVRCLVDELSLSEGVGIPHLHDLAPPSLQIADLLMEAMLGTSGTHDQDTVTAMQKADELIVEIMRVCREAYSKSLLGPARSSVQAESSERPAATEQVSQIPGENCLSVTNPDRDVGQSLRRHLSAVNGQAQTHRFHAHIFLKTFSCRSCKLPVRISPATTP
jgi:hypothetical protein